MKLELKRGGCAAQLSTLGGELVSYRDEQGMEYIWQGDPASWMGQNPVLFPIVGGLTNGQVTIKGQPYGMGRHGFARKTEFSLAEQGADYAVLELRDSAETRKQYPYAFCLRVCHRLTDRGFTTTFTVENPGEEPLPFCIGAHTGFRCPLRPGERFEDYQVTFGDADAFSKVVYEGMPPDFQLAPYFAAPNRLPLRHALFDAIDTLTTEGLAHQTVTLLHKDTGHGVRMDFPGFPMLALWTKPDSSAPYICIEPWLGCGPRAEEGDVYTNKHHCTTLQPAATHTLAYEVIRI